MQKIRKILRAVSEIFKDGRTDGRTTDMGDYIGPLSGKPGVQNGKYCDSIVMYIGCQQKKEEKKEV